MVNLPIGDDKKSELIGYLHEKFYYATEARRTQVDSKWKRWMDNYAGKPKEITRSTPWPNASNFMPQLIRMHTDILHARIFNVVMGTKPFWNPKTFIECPHEWLESLGQWIEYESFYNIDIQDVLDKTLLRSLKCGTTFLKAPWVQDEVWLGAANAMGGFTETARFTEGVEAFPLSFDDFYAYPITADKYQKISIKFHKLRFDKQTVQLRVAQGRWDRKAADHILAQGEGRNETPAKEAQAAEAGVDLNPYNTLPFKCVEAWLNYPITNDPTKFHSIVVVFNPEMQDKDGYLRGYFNPSSVGMDPFVQFTPLPREELIYGFSIPEILEGAQEECAQIHNWRRDANTVANSPMWKKRRGAGVPNPSQQAYPGKVFELDEMDDLDILQFSPVYNDMINEETFLLEWVERQTGGSTPYQGLGSGTMDGKRGIYTSQGTMMMMSAGNNRIDTYLRRYRGSFNRFGNIIYYSNKDWRPDGAEYAAFGEAGATVRRTFKFKEPEGYRGLYFDIGASEAGANQEVDRNNILLMANTLAGYHRQLTEVAGIAAQLPEGEPMREALLVVLDSAKDLTNRVLFAFNIGDRKRLVPDLRAVLAGGTQQANDAAESRGLPTTEEPFGAAELEGLGSSIAAVTGGRFAGVGA